MTQRYSMHGTSYTCAPCSDSCLFFYSFRFHTLTPIFSSQSLETICHNHHKKEKKISFSHLALSLKPPANTHAFFRNQVLIFSPRLCVCMFSEKVCQKNTRTFLISSLMCWRCKHYEMEFMGNGKNEAFKVPVESP